jgi:hypothetical protein
VGCGSDSARQLGDAVGVGDGTADANQVLLVGTKVHGDSLPRNLSYSSPEGNGGTSSAGQIVVGNVFGNDAGNNPNLPGHQTLLAQ